MAAKKIQNAGLLRAKASGAKASAAPRDISAIPEYVVKAALRKGADDVVCEAGVGRTRQVRFANSSVTASKTYEVATVSIFIAHRGRVVSSDINSLSAIDSAIDGLFSLAKATSPNRSYGGIAQGPRKYRKAGWDKKIEGLDDGKIMDFVQAGIGASLRAGAKRAAGTLYTSVTEDHVATSGGLACSDKGADIQVSLRAFADKDASGHSVSVATTLGAFEPARAGEKAGRIAEMALGPKDCDAGKFDVLWEPLAIANFVEGFGRSASAFNVDSGVSYLKDKIGKKVASELVTLHDDGTMDGGMGSALCDSEGVPTQRTAIVEKGTLKSYLHNTSTAKRYKVDTTGNAGLISPHPWNLVFAPGRDSFDRLIGGIDRGIYITNLWYTRFKNYQTGDFSTIPRDGIFLIRNGEIAGPVNGIRVSENMLRLFGAVTAVGSRQEQIEWWEVNTPTFMPHVVTAGTNITKSTQ